MSEDQNIQPRQLLEKIGLKVPLSDTELKALAFAFGWDGIGPSESDELWTTLVGFLLERMMGVSAWMQRPPWEKPERPIDEALCRTFLPNERQRVIAQLKFMVGKLNPSFDGSGVVDEDQVKDVAWTMGTMIDELQKSQDEVVNHEDRKPDLTILEDEPSLLSEWESVIEQLRLIRSEMGFPGGDDFQDPFGVTETREKLGGLIDRIEKHLQVRGKRFHVETSGANPGEKISIGFTLNFLYDEVYYCHRELFSIVPKRASFDRWKALRFRLADLVGHVCNARDKYIRGKRM